MMRDTLTEYQRLNLLNQYKILHDLAVLRGDEEAAASYDRLAKIVTQGYVVEYDRLTSELSKEMSEEDSQFVLNILEMYSVMYTSLERFQNSKLTLQDIWFDGFDGNEEFPYYAYCKYILLDECRFPALTANGRRDFNAHGNRIRKYLAMLRKWEAMEMPTVLNDSELRELLASENPLHNRFLSR